MKNYFWFVIILIFGCERKDISKNDILSAEKISGLSFSSSERDSLLPVSYTHLTLPTKA